MFINGAPTEIATGTEGKKLDKNRQILDPEIRPDIPADYNADLIWNGIEPLAGTRLKVLVTPDPTGETQRVVAAVDQDANLRERVLFRYENLLSLVATECLLNGTPKIQMIDSDRQTLFQLAHRLETDAITYTQKARDAANKVAPLDREKARLIGDRLIQNYVAREFAIVQHLSHKAIQRHVESTITPAKTEQIKTDPRQPEWKQAGQEWLKATPNQREGIIKKIAQKHASVIASQMSYEAQQGYYYINPKPVNPLVAKEIDNKIKAATNEQDLLVLQLQKAKDQFGPSGIINLPTAKFRDYFSSLGQIGEEFKVHLMPKLEDQPMVLDRLLSLLEQKPELRDKIRPMKVRVRNNGQADSLPELVIYTSSQHYREILACLQQEFSDLKGLNRTPRYNQEVANGLIYFAQSGGDLKNELLDMNVLSKIFDPQSDHAKLRV